MSSCAGYKRNSRAYVRPYEQGEVKEAARAASYLAKHAKGTRSEALYRLEQGRTLYAAGEYKKSNYAFERADRLMRQYAREARIKLLNQTGSLITNLRALPYRGRVYDRIMANTYQALNDMHLDDFDEARVDLNRAYEAQKLAVYKNKKRIARARQAAERANAESVFNLSSSLNSAELQTRVRSRYQALGNLTAYADFVNPYSEFLQGLFRIAHGVSESDYEQGLTSFKRVQAMVDNPYLDKDVQLARQVANGAAPPKRTYVFFETGMAPSRDEIRIDLPLFLVNGHIDYFGAAFPQLNFDQTYVKTINVVHHGKLDRPRMLVDMDRVIGREFYDHLPLLITQTLIASAAKAGVAYGLDQATRDRDPYVNLLTRIGTTLYQAVLNHADLRTWRTLPKQVQYCSFPTPSDDTITIRGLVVDQPRINLKPGRVNVVMITSMQPGSKAVVSQFAFK